MIEIITYRPSGYTFTGRVFLETSEYCSWLVDEQTAYEICSHLHNRPMPAVGRVSFLERKPDKRYPLPKDIAFPNAVGRPSETAYLVTLRTLSYDATPQPFCKNDGLPCLPSIN